MTSCSLADGLGDVPLAIAGPFTAATAGRGWSKTASLPSDNGNDM
jgi:hypothetical protein